MGVTPRWNKPFLMGSRWKSTKSHFPFIVSLSKFTWSYEIEHWLLNIGRNHEDWEWWYDGKCWKFEFKNEEDKVRFILQWV